MLMCWRGSFGGKGFGGRGHRFLCAIYLLIVKKATFMSGIEDIEVGRGGQMKRVLLCAKGKSG